jgi:hypothetical protein
MIQAGKSFMLIFIVILVPVFILFIISDGDIKGFFDKHLGKFLGKTNKTPISKNDKNKDVKKKKNKNDDKHIRNLDSRDFLNFDKIEILSDSNPIGIVVRNDGKFFCGAIEVFGLNYNLLSDQEKEIAELTFEQLLNGLDHDIQLFTQSRKIEIDNYSRSYNERLDELKIDIENAKIRYQKMLDRKEGLDEIEDLEKEIFRKSVQYEYGIRTADYIRDSCSNKNMLQRRYFIIVSYEHDPREYSEIQTYEDILDSAFNDISGKLHSISSSLSRGGLDSEILTGYQYMDLIYSSYNKEESEILPLANALDSQFSHYVTTSEPIEIKAIRRTIKELVDLERELLLEKDEIEEEEKIYDLYEMNLLLEQQEKSTDNSTSDEISITNGAVEG